MTEKIAAMPWRALPRRLAWWKLASSRSHPERDEKDVKNHEGKRTRVDGRPENT